MWIVLLGVFAPLSAKLNSQKVDTSTSLLPEDSEAGRVAETLAKRFAGGDKPTTVLLYRRAGGLTPEDQKLIAENAQEAAKVPLAGAALPAFVDGKPAPQQVTRAGAPRSPSSRSPPASRSGWRSRSRSCARSPTTSPVCSSTSPAPRRSSTTSTPRSSRPTSCSSS